MMEVNEKIRGEVNNILSKLEEGNIDMEGVKRATREGLIALVEGMDAVMNGISDGIQKERSVRNDEVSRNEKRLEVMEGRLKENKEKLEGMRQAKEREARKESSQSLKEKLRQGERQLKYLDVDFGRVTSSRREIVEKAIAYMKEEVVPQTGKGWMESSGGQGLSFLERKLGLGKWRNRGFIQFPLCWSSERRGTRWRWRSC